MIKSKSVKSLYNKIGVLYEQNRPLAISDRTELPAVIFLAGDVRNKRVLDAGCGPGRHAKKLLNKGALVTGIDISEEMIQIARRHCRGKGEFLVSDFQTIRFRPATFDLIIASLSLMYAPNVNPVMKNFSRLLKPKGSLIFSLYHPVRFFHKIPNFDFSKRAKVWIHLQGCDVTVFNYYHPMQKYFDALVENDFHVTKFIEPVLSRKYKGWPEDNYRVPRSIVIQARKR